MIELKAGLCVQIKEAAFHCSTDIAEINARGQEATLIGIADQNPDGDHVWRCRCADGSIVEPLESEFDVVESDDAN